MLSAEMSKVFNRLVNEANAAQRFETQAILSALEKVVGEYSLTGRQTALLSKFLEETSVVLNNIRNHKHTIDQLRRMNARYEALLSEILSMSDEQIQGLPPLFMLNDKANKTQPSVTKQAKNDFFDGLTSFLTDLSNPNANHQQALTTFLGCVVQILISVVVGFIKPFLGKGHDADEKANRLEAGFSKFFSSMMNEDVLPKKSNSFMPAYVQASQASEARKDPSDFIDTEEDWTLDAVENLDISVDSVHKHRVTL